MLFIILLVFLFLLLLLYIFKEKIDLYLKKIDFYYKIKRLIDSLSLKFIALVLAGINGYIMLCLGSEEKAKWFKKIFGVSGTFILDNGGLFVFLSIIIAGLYPWFSSFISSKCNDFENKYYELSKQYDIVLKVLEQIERVVIEKRQRFARASRDFLSAPQTPKHKTVFERITQPDNQIKLLIEALHDCIRSIYPNEFSKVALIKVKDGHLDDWVCHSPYDTKPRTTIAQLKNSNSTFSRTLSTKKMIIVADTQIEIQKPSSGDILYIQGNTDPNESWCQVCVPIQSINSNEIIFIISIAIKRANVISADNEKFLEWLFKFFISRLALEHSLKELKEHISK
ncbi:TPA: hypothetical protein U2L27_001553 [Acinetobacter baumannii]|nr:hypothetical protein [Acinetobacter baumannii]